ncbi:MAG TPA: DUF5060 domain-containing protein [Bacteroidota bacterium]|nr:DUF5060 domain-containing protein [Bacteroidota bacterium]
MKRPSLPLSGVVWIQIAFLFIACVQMMVGSSHDVSFTASNDSVAAFDYIEISATVIAPIVSNPFTEATLTGTFVNRGTGEKWSVGGFADSDDGSEYRIRFMPPMPGAFDYEVTFKDKALQKTFTGTLRAFDGHRRGLLRVDPKYRWHFIWSGTGEHYFFNGTTAYWLMGWKDERIIH